MKGLFYLILAAALLASCAGDSTQEQTDGTHSTLAPDDTLMRQVHFTAEDGLEVVADLYPNPNAKRVIILLHQANGSRGEYLPVSLALTRRLRDIYLILNMCLLICPAIPGNRSGMSCLTWPQSKWACWF